MIEVDVALSRGDFDLNVSFASSAGVTALFGPSGSGKSTLIDLIAGLARADRGRIVVGGRVLADSEKGIFLSTRKRRVGLVFQDAMLFPHLNVRQNLRFGAFFAPRGARRLPMSEVVDKLGIGALMDRRPIDLSGGERQRVGVARALLAAPDILLMDEPFASLDVARRRKAMGLVEMTRDLFGIPIVLVSHQIEEVMRLAGQVVMIERGKIKEVGAPEAIFASARPENPSERFGVGSSLTCTASDFDARYGLTRLHHPSGEIFAAGSVATPGAATRIYVKAVDVALARKPPLETSIRTVLRGKIIRVAGGEGPLALALLELAGGEQLYASLTRMAADELQLAPGVEAFALVKAVALDEREMAAG
ncbi:molybdenum ABC transporter ATP-binding protein [Rhodoblastus sp.]|jgi:molybdate transport system ATP-binding protein|uniref:molybdenum ABC transporter ATP-binding protein n=1 Tax=Rhodoblastus sp. TaxID=1962975 RepID=UPI0025DBECD1|nr:molybdenum ABC transporter ATP-binding protein [Rhodoblastus sp.]